MTFMTTAVTPEAGIPFTPPTWRVTTPPGPTRPFGAPVPSRVSRKREGAIGTKRPLPVVSSAVTVYALGR